VASGKLIIKLKRRYGPQFFLDSVKCSPRPFEMVRSKSHHGSGVGEIGRKAKFHIHNIGVVIFQRQRFDEAISEATEALELLSALFKRRQAVETPDRDAVLYNLRLLRASFAIRCSDLQLALHDVNMALRITQGVALPFQMRAMINTQLGRTDEAIKDTVSAVNIDPTLASPLLQSVTFNSQQQD